MPSQTIPSHLSGIKVRSARRILAEERRLMSGGGGDLIDAAWTDDRTPKGGITVHTMGDIVYQVTAESYRRAHANRYPKDGTQPTALLRLSTCKIIANRSKEASRDEEVEHLA